MTNVFLADDHAIVLDGLEHLLSTTPDLRVVGRATHARTLLSLAGSGSWDLLVLDLSLPGGGGLEALARLRQLEPALKIVVAPGGSRPVAHSMLYHHDPTFPIGYFPVLGMGQGPAVGGPVVELRGRFQ